MKSESEFIADAIALIQTISGEQAADLGPDTELPETGWFDSLLLVTFLDFIEAELGAPLPISDETGIPAEHLTTIRKAYRLVARE
jgi:acyl carrier protein